ncbi:hypothetical protein [Clostridium saccharoperbutylacetonicum]
MGKNAIIFGIASAVVVIACGAGGAIYALNASSADSNSNKATANLELKKEQAKLNGWNQKDGAWYYYKDDKVQTGWVQDNGSWYYCDDSGKMKLNWLQDKNKWYYLGSDGKLRSGWIKDNDKWYYMNNDGTMAVNTTVDGNYINQNGVIEETPKPKAQQEDNDGINNSKLSKEEAMNLIEKEDYSFVAKQKRSGDELMLDTENAADMLEEYNAPSEDSYLIDLGSDDGVSCAYLVGKYSHKVYKCGEANTFIYLIKNGRLIQRYKGSNYILKNDWVLNSGLNGSYNGN